MSTKSTTPLEIKLPVPKDPQTVAVTAVASVKSDKDVVDDDEDEDEDWDTFQSFPASAGAGGNPLDVKNAEAERSVTGNKAGDQQDKIHATSSSSEDEEGKMNVHKVTQEDELPKKGDSDSESTGNTGTELSETDVHIKERSGEARKE